MSQTPSNRRREGRNAFDPEDPSCDPMVLCPYQVVTNPEFSGLDQPNWLIESKQKDWLDGWNEAKRKYLQELKEQENEQETRRYSESCEMCGRDCSCPQNI